ncbi:hypothetical protein [Enterococcus gallinarum]|uniref:hypothetical protein n=1 Tax=Enterococcus gallinarum TaxID=1353 RepID=UPI00403FE3FB
MLVLAIKKTAPSVSAQNDPAVFLEEDTFWFLLISMTFGTVSCNKPVEQACQQKMKAK